VTPLAKSSHHLRILTAHFHTFPSTNPLEMVSPLLSIVLIQKQKITVTTMKTIKTEPSLRFSII
jgi:hypothetical protein